MPESHEKITIRREELVEPPPLPITIRESDLAINETPPPRQPPAFQAVLVDDPPPKPAARFPLVAVVVAFGVLFMFVAVAGVAYLVWPRPDWIEQVASRADRSVVLIQAEPDGFGTGFVVASDGDAHLILTNRHVVAGAEECLVRSRLGRVAPAVAVSYPKDDDIDLALLIVNSPGLRAMGPIGRFRDVRVGEAAVAVGHPLGLDYTVSSGIISAKRNGQELQTSAPISPGNSGGPLINKSGYVIGVNTRTIDPAEGQSLAFATRADLVLDAGAWRLEPGVADLLSKVGR